MPATRCWRKTDGVCVFDKCVSRVLLSEFQLFVPSLPCVVVLFVSLLERAEFVCLMTSRSKLQAAFVRKEAQFTQYVAPLCWHILVHYHHLLKRRRSMLAVPHWLHALNAGTTLCRRSATCRALSFAGGWRGASNACFECSRRALMSWCTQATAKELFIVMSIGIAERMVQSDETCERCRNIRNFGLLLQLESCMRANA